jgi:hypothetical protein
MTHYKNCDCYDCCRSRERRKEWQFSLLFVLLVILGAVLMQLFAGCATTVVPVAVESHQASYDQGAQNSGVISLLPTGALLTEHAVDRYNALVAIYGREFLPVITRDYGITRNSDATFEITNEALQKFILMNTWHRMGREPKNK